MPEPDPMRRRDRLVVTCDRDPSGYRLSAWEPAGEDTHEVTRTPSGATWGRIDTRRHPNPSEVPTGLVERVVALQTWALDRQREAMDAIATLYPGAVEGFRSCGQIVALGDPSTFTKRARRGRDERAAPPAFAGMTWES